MTDSSRTRLHQSEEFSDCKLICGPYHFNLHKVILASKSDYFKAAFKHGTFKVIPLSTNVHKIITDSGQEGDTGIIELKTVQSDGETSAEGDDIYDEPEIVKLMVEYFYHFDYLRNTESLPHPTAKLPPNARTTESSSATQTAKREHIRVRLPPPTLQSQQHELPSQGYIIEHAKVFAIAVKYQIDGLRGLAAAKFKDAATAYWKYDDFVEAIYVVYSSTFEGVTQLRDVVTDILHQHFDDLEDMPEVETALCNVPRLAYDLLKRSRMGGKQGKQSQLPAPEEKYHNSWVRSMQNANRQRNIGLQGQRHG